MPDQLPSAILDSTNSFDSIFALDIDTKQRFDNILNNQQKPIDYPIPDYNKDFTPQGLPQDDLLNPQKMKGTLGEALFSSDPRMSTYAEQKLRAGQSKLPVNQGIGVPNRFEYNKAMDKFLNGDYGYNPYQSLEDNEDFNYRYDYLNDNVVKRFVSNIGTGVTRFLGSVLLKLGQTAGYLGSMVGNGIQELYDKDNNFMADVADNSMSRWFEGLEEDMKNSNLLQVYKPKGWDDKGFFSKLGNGAFWTDEVADGAAFMGEMVASMYLMGGLGKIGAVGRLGATEINLTKALGRLGTVGRYAGRGLDTALKIGTGADNLSGIGRWAFATTSESAFEASQLYKTRKDELKAQRQAGNNNYTDQEIEAISGDSAAASFKANMLILSASNAFENRFIFNPLFKRLGVGTPNPRARLISVSESTESLEELAKASRKTPDYSTWLGKKLNWKDPNSRLRFYGSRALSATAVEGFWEENAQLAVERLAGADNLSFNTFAKKLKDQTVGALSGNDPEAATNIGLGGLIGIGGTGIVAKVRGGDRLFQGERRKEEEDTLKAVEIYEHSRKNFLSFQDIYQRDDKTGKPTLDEDGNLQIDPVKAAGIFDGINAFISKQEAASKADDPLFRKQVQDSAMMDYVVAAKNAGIFDRASKRFAALGEINQADLVNLGFDPNTTVDSAYMKDSMKEFGKIYDQVQASPSVRLGKNDTIQDELSRKNALYKSRAAIYSISKLMNEFQSKMLDKDFPSVFDPEAEGNTSEIQQYNSLVFQKEGLDQWAALAKDHGNFYNDFIRDHGRRIDTEMARLEGILDDMMENTPLNIQVTPRGFVVSAHKYDYLKPSATDVLSEVAGESQKKTIARLRNDMKSRRALIEADMNMDIEYSAQKKHADYSNTNAQYSYLASKFGHLQDGIKNYKAYLDYEDSIQKKDAEVDTANQPGPATPPAGGPATATTPEATATETPVAPTTPPLTEKQVIENEDVLNTLFKMLSNAFEGFTRETTDSRYVEPDFAGLAQYINEKVGQNRIAVETTLLKFMSDRGNIILNQIANNTFNPEKDASIDAYKSATKFMEELVPMLTDEELGGKVLDYMDSVDDAIANYKPIQVELTDAEKAAIEALGPVDLTQGRLAPYGAILQDPSASNQDKKDALRYISDQLLAPGTAEETSNSLGGRAARAIDELGYPAPEEKASVAETTNGVSAYAPQALINSFAARIAKGDQMTSDDELQFYENNKEAIEDRLRELQGGEQNEATETSPDEKADIERRRQEELKQNRYAVPVSIVKKHVADGDNLTLDESDTQLADARIEKIISTAKSPEDAKERVRAAGYVLDYTFNPAFLAFVQDRIDGKTTRTFSEFRKDTRAEVNAKYDEELAALSKPTPEQPSGLKVGDKVIVGTKKDGESAIKEIRGDKVLLEDGRQVKLENLTLATDQPEQEQPFPEKTAILSDEERKEILRKLDKLIEMQERGQASFAGDDFLLFNLVRNGFATQSKIDEFNRIYNETLGDYQNELAEEPSIVFTNAKEAAADTEGSGIQEVTPTPPVIPPTPPKIAENSEEEFASQQNFLDVQIDAAKLNGLFTFPQNQPEEIIMEGSKPKITDGAIQLKTTTGDQQNQLLRQHNILKRMGSKNNIINFWSVDDEENPMFKIKLEIAGARNEAKYAPWVYNTAKGKVSPVTGKPYAFPYIVAVVVDQIGNYVYFDDNGNVSTKSKGKPFGFPYAVEDYKSENLNTSRRGVQLGTGEPLNGINRYVNDDPLKDLSTALQRGVDLYGSIDQVTDGRLSSYNIDNSGTNYSRAAYTQRSVQQMMKDGDISDDATFVLTSGNFVTYPLTTASDTEPQEIKVGQPFLFDERSGLKLPLRGKKIKDLTIDGKPFITDQIKQAIEGLDKDRRIIVEREYSTPETQQFMENLYNTLRLLVYSRDTPVFLNEDKTAITVLDQRVNPKSLMETEVNYTKTTDVSIISNPFEADSEGFSYEDFVKENFLSGAIPAEVTKGQKQFEKLNRRIIFTLDKTHQEVLDSIGAESAPKKPIRMQTTDFSKFVNKTYKKRGGTSTVTVTGYADGNFTIVGPSGEVKQSVNDFMKSLRSLEEVKLPTPSEEVKEDFENNIKLSEAEQKELNEKAKDFSKDDEENLNFNC